MKLRWMYRRCGTRCTAGVVVTDTVTVVVVVVIAGVVG